MFAAKISSSCVSAIPPISEPAIDLRFITKGTVFSGGLSRFLEILLIPKCRQMTMMTDMDQRQHGHMVLYL